MQSITAGFNLVTNNISILLLPIGLDLLLWFGPHLRVKTLLESTIIDLNAQLFALNTPGMNELLQPTQELWQKILEQFNLLSFLHTYPIGVPSLLASGGSLYHPLGSAPIIELPTAELTLGLWLAFTLLGVFLGTFFFAVIASFSSPQQPTPVFSRLFWMTLQTIILTLILILIIIVIAIPLSVLMTILAMVSPMIAQATLFIIGLFLVWLLMPLLFSPHGIYSFQFSAMKSILTSIRLVRSYLPGAGFFLLVVILIGQGLDIIWRIPPETSWMALIGILGHAFITTALLTASFIYYRGGITWMQGNIKKASAQPDPQV